MKRRFKYQIVVIFLLSFIITLNLFAHKEPTHQYIVREAYRLLKNFYNGNTIPIMNDWVGTNQGRDTPGPVDIGYIVSGAWNEDVHDIVFHHGKPVEPTGLYNKALASVTHFWKVDGADLHASDENQTVLTPIGLDLIYAENAWQKMRAFRDGGWNFYYWNSGSNTGSIYRYDGLINLFNTGRIFEVSTVDELGREFAVNRWVTLTEVYKKRFVFNFLGRMAHLLTDMSVPAHVHNDEHGTWADKYEDAMNVEGDYPSFASYWNADNAGSLINPYQPYDDPLHYLMYSTNQVTDYFASNRVDGNTTYSSTLPILNQTIPTLYGPTTTGEYNVVDEYPDPEAILNLYQIRDGTVPYVIRATAGLLYWFATQTGLLPLPFTVNISRTFEFDPTETLTPQYSGGECLSIFASTPCIKNGRQYVFSQWSDGNASNPRIVCTDMNLTAIYKVHLASNYSVPTRGGGQQRIASTYRNTSDTYGEDIIVYQSAGEIWSTSHDYATDTWSNETRLSDGSGGHSEPSIASRGMYAIPFLYGDGVYAVWQKQTGPNSYDVNFAVRTENGWINTRPYPYNGQPLKVNSSTCTVPPKPVLTIYEEDTSPTAPKELITIMYRQNQTTITGKYARVNTGFDGGFISCTGNSSISTNLPGTYDGVLCESQPAILPTGAETITLAYNKYASNLYTGTDNLLWTANCITNFSGVTCYWYAPEGVDASDGRPLNTDPYNWYGSLYGTYNIASPQVIRRSGKTVYAWIEQQSYEDPNVPFIVYQERSASGWLNAVVWDMLDESDWSNIPTSVSLGNNGSQSALMWTVGNTIYKTTSANWGSVTTVRSGHDPQMTYFGGMRGNAPSSDLGFYLYTENGSPFQLLRTPASFSKTGFGKSESGEVAGSIERYNALSPIATEKTVAVLYSRMISITDTSTGAQISISVSEPTLGKRKLTFNPVNDTLPDINENNFLKYLSTQETMVGSDDDTLSCAVAIRSYNLKKRLSPITLELADGKTLAKVVSLASIDQDTGKSASRKSIAMPMRQHQQRSISLALKGLDISSLGNNLQFKLTHGYKVGSGLHSGEKAINEKVNPPPTTYELSENYPNPFNPATTIGYQIPKDGMVVLKIYDMLGREVRTLVNEYKSVGRYSVVFDASNLASGMYIYRIVSQPTEGGKKDIFTAVKKMMLIK